MDSINYPEPVYGFLGIIERRRQSTVDSPIPRILDCGAGGETPPLGLFYERGFETAGIDISEEQIKSALLFEQKHGMALNIRHGDVRRIPFENESFDYVFEYNSICHLTKADNGIAIREMMRVLKKGGLCFLGFMGVESWPILGKKVGPNEFRLMEGPQEVVHSAYEDNEPDAYFSDWKIIQKEKRTRWFFNWSASLSMEDWMGWLDEERTQYSRSDWEEMYQERIVRGNSTHTFYVIQKPG